MAKQQQPQTDFTDEVIDDSPVDQPAKDVDGVPYCRVHHCRMKASSGGRKGNPTTYYSCPVPGCDAKAQMIRTPRESIVPTNPVTCPRCSDAKKQVVCSRNEQRSTGAYVIVECPNCGWKSNAMAVPQLVAGDLMRQKRTRPEEIGER